MSMLNLLIHQWASSRQHHCGIEQSKLSVGQSGLRSCLDEWLHLHVHLSTCVGYIYKFMNKKWFSRLTISKRPQAGGMYWLSHLFSYKWGAHCWFWVCSSAASSFIRKYFSQHISIKSTQTWYMYAFHYHSLWHKHAIIKRRRICIPSIAICIK